MGIFCELNDTDPKAMLKVAKTKEFRVSLMDFVRRMEEEGKAGSYIARFKKVLNSWLAFNGLNVMLKVNVRGESDTPTIANERVPSKEELNKILRMATPRARVSIALIAFSGLRPQSLGNYEGSDGIRLGDFVEAEISEDSMKFAKVPTMLVVRKSLSKARHQYFTFVLQQTITYIQEAAGLGYIVKRKIKTEDINNLKTLIEKEGYTSTASGATSGNFGIVFMKNYQPVLIISGDIGSQEIRAVGVIEINALLHKCF